MPRKHIDPQKFTLKRNALNKTTVKAEKTAKPGSQWYYKHPNNVRAPENTLPNQHAYELEAIASDLFRFILGLSRAAKTRVVKSDSVEAVASQHNPAGYKTASPKEFEDVMNDPGMVWALSVLNEGDLNPANFGVNDNNETAHIDYDLSLERLKARMYGTTIYSRHGAVDIKPSELLAVLLPRMERDEKDLQSEPGKIETRKKFFPMLLKSLLLTPDVLDTISARHTELPLLQKGLKTFMSEQLDPVDKLLGSKALAEYLINTDFQQLKPELRQFFKFEFKLNAREADRLLAAIEDRFISVKLLSFDKNPELLDRYVETPRSEEAQEKLLKNMRLLAATHSVENIPAILHRLGKDHYALNDFNDTKTLESYLPKIRQGDASQCKRVLGELYRETQAPDFAGDSRMSVLVKKNLLGHQLESNDFRAIKATSYTIDTFADDLDLLKNYLTQYHQKDYEQYSNILKQLYEQAQQSDNNIPKDSSQYRLLSKLQQLDDYKQQRKGQAEYKHYHGYFFGYSKTEKLAAVKGGEEQLLGITAVLDKKQEKALNQGELKSRWNGPS